MKTMSDLAVILLETRLLAERLWMAGRNFIAATVLDLLKEYRVLYDFKSSTKLVLGDTFFSTSFSIRLNSCYLMSLRM